MKRCRLIPKVSITLQNQVVDLRATLTSMDPYLRQQFLRNGTYDANVSLDDPEMPFDNRDFDLVDVLEYEKAINPVAYMQPKPENPQSPTDQNSSESGAQPALQGAGNNANHNAVSQADAGSGFGGTKI